MYAARQHYLLYGLVFIAAFCLVLLVGKTTVLPSGPTTRVLFIGNSFTYVHDVPGQFKVIAESKGKHVEAASATPPGVTFHQHLQDGNTLGAIASKPWDYIVLQEQSQHFAFPHERVERESNADARQLASYIHQHAPNAKIVFYETWGDKNGDQPNCRELPELCSYDGMQRRIILNYHLIAGELHAMLAPVGEVWWHVREHHPEIELYEADNHHQSAAGAYLSACTFYRTLFHEGVTGASENDMSAADAAAIQQAVDQTQPY